MASITSASAQQVLDEIGHLKSTIDSFGEAARTKLIDIRTIETDVLTTLPLTPTGKIDDTPWSQKSEKDQITAYNRLLQVRDSLRSAAGLDGPTDREHLMYGEYASTKSIIVWLLFCVILVGALLSEIVGKWSIATSTDFAPHILQVETAITALKTAKTNESAAVGAEAQAQAKKSSSVGGDGSAIADALKQLDASSKELAKKRAELDFAQQQVNTQVAEAIKAIREGAATEAIVLTMVILLGALGGSLHLVGSLVMYIGNGQLKRRWLPYYLSLPVVGAALAPIVYMLLRVGILSPTGLANGGSAGTSNLNLVGIYAFAALTGMFAKTATDKLSEVFGTLFRTGESPGKDKIGPTPSAKTNP